MPGNDGTLDRFDETIEVMADHRVGRPQRVPAFDRDAQVFAPVLFESAQVILPIRFQRDDVLDHEVDPLESHRVSIQFRIIRAL
ncbi:MAG: hypothetical protein ABIW36_03960 [Terrimesophilobacter sp.]